MEENGGKWRRMEGNGGDDFCQHYRIFVNGGEWMKMEENGGNRVRRFHAAHAVPPNFAQQKREAAA